MKKVSLIAGALLAVSGLAYGQEKIGDLYYYLTDDTKTASVSRENMFSTNYSGLTDAAIPEVVVYGDTEYTVTAIGYMAFKNCMTLKTVSMPSTLNVISSSAFYSCTALTSVSVPDAVVSIGESVFANCNRLTSISLGESVSSIGSSAFLSCGITSIVLPEAVKSIGQSAFRDCSSLKEITLPAGVTEVSTYLFMKCVDLESVKMDDGVTKIDEGAFWGCSKLASLQLPSALKTIGKTCFYGCDAITTLTLPENVEMIYAGAFSNMSDLAELISLNPVPPTLEEDTENYPYQELYQNTTLYVPAESLEVYRAADGWKNFNTIQAINDPSVGIGTVIGDGNPGLTVRSGKGTIRVHDLAAGTTIEVYAIGGEKVYGGTCHVLDGLSHGTYVVKASGKTAKVIVQ